MKLRVAELDELLSKEGIARDFYSFDRRIPPLEGYILDQAEDKTWRVLYSERESAREFASFDNEFDACLFFYHKLKDVFDEEWKPAARH